MTIKDIGGLLQVGASSTAANNIAIDTSANNGTASIYMGNAGAPVTNVATIGPTGAVAFNLRPTLVGTQSVVQCHGGGALGSTNTQIRRYSTTDVNTGTDITYADSVTLGASYTINTSGVYSICQVDIASAGGVLVAILVNTATQPANIGATMPAAIHSIVNNGGVSVSWTGYLAAGAVVRPSLNGTGGSSQATNAGFFISRVA